MHVRMSIASGMPRLQIVIELCRQRLTCLVHFTHSSAVTFRSGSSGPTYSLRESVHQVAGLCHATEKAARP